MSKTMRWMLIFSIFSEISWGNDLAKHILIRQTQKLLPRFQQFLGDESHSRIHPIEINNHEASDHFIQFLWTQTEKLKSLPILNNHFSKIHYFPEKWLILADAQINALCPLPTINISVDETIEWAQTKLFLAIIVYRAFLEATIGDNISNVPANIKRLHVQVHTFKKSFKSSDGLEHKKDLAEFLFGTLLNKELVTLAQATETTEARPTPLEAFEPLVFHSWWTPDWPPQRPLPLNLLKLLKRVRVHFTADSSQTGKMSTNL